MAFVPKISISLSNSKCNTLNVREETGIFVVTVNDEGWGDTNPLTTDVTTAFVNLYNLEDELLQTITIKNTAESIDYYAAAVTAPIPSEFTVLENIPWEEADGIYRVSYRIFDGITYYNNKTQHVLFLCNLCNCINSIKKKLLETCNKEKKDKYYEELQQIELLKYSIECAYSCKDFTTATSLLVSAQKLCSIFADCGCGCGGDC